MGNSVSQTVWERDNNKKSMVIESGDRAINCSTNNNKSNQEQNIEDNFIILDDTLTKHSNSTLIVLDLNGTLIDRIFKNRSCPYDSNMNKIKPDSIVKGRKIYKRPNLDSFLDYLLDNFSVAVWSCSNKQNTLAIVDSIFKKKINVVSSDNVAPIYGLEFIKSRENMTCHSVNTESLSAYEDTRKDHSDSSLRKNLDQIWNEYPMYSSNNTVIIDDSLLRTKLYPENAINLKEFDVLDGEWCVDRELNNLVVYFNLMKDYIKSTGKSSIEFMNLNKFPDILEN